MFILYYELFTVYIVFDTVDTHFINTVRMEDTDHEVEFRKIVYEKFAKNKRHMIPRDVYNETIDILKHISDDLAIEDLFSVIKRDILLLVIVVVIVC